MMNVLYLSIFILVFAHMENVLCLAPKSIFLNAGFHFTYIGTYLLVITSREKVGTFLGFPIFRITAMKFLPCNDASRFATAQEVRFCTKFNRYTIS